MNPLPDLWSVCVTREASLSSSDVLSFVVTGNVLLLFVFGFPVEMSGFTAHSLTSLNWDLSHP